MRIVAIDPGGTTGIAVFGRLLFEGAEATEAPGFESAVKHLESEIRSLSTYDLVVCERYTIGAGSIAKSRKGQNTAIELIGVARYLSLKQGCAFELQSPADAKTFSTDDKLKRVGFYIKGADHARDACRHLLLAAVRHGVVRPEELV